MEFQTIETLGSNLQFIGMGLPSCRSGREVDKAVGVDGGDKVVGVAMGATKLQESTWN
jgi:hypothetical protein